MSIGRIDIRDGTCIIAANLGGGKLVFYVLLVLAGALGGGALAWLLSSTIAKGRCQSRIADAERRAGAVEATVAELRGQAERSSGDCHSLRSRLEQEQASRIRAETRLVEAMQRLEAEKALLDDARSKLTDTFKAAAGDALQGSTTAFLKLAGETFDKALAEARGDLGKRQEAIKGLVSPLSDSLKLFEEHVRSIEKGRQEAYAGLAEQVKGLSTAQQQLQKETASLVTALRRPEVRGRWGEMTLRRTAELAGMSEHCDFCEQVVASSDDGRLRPDLIVRLPEGREVVVDAKVSLTAYLDALAADGEDRRKECLAQHAAQLRSHMNSLADKRYWAQFPLAPEYVVMFIPGESFFAAAVESDPGIIEDGMERKVVMATPTTLIALLRAVAFGWRQQKLARNAQEISDLGKELYKRMRKLAEYVTDIGKGLDRAADAYNRAVGSMEDRVLPAARRFKELGAASEDELSLMPPITTTVRSLSAPELKGDGQREA